jgi:Fic-DOC domain mobile mystery protein B
MGLNLEYWDGQTPLDEDEKEGLKLKFITTREELDEFEQLNIEEAVKWSMKRNFKIENILTEIFILNLHKRMYQNVWHWAGGFRKTNKNIGIEYWKISAELKYLLDDIHFWIKNKTFTYDEITLRFKHRLVSIHCFANGNGRHSRLIADILIEKIFKEALFSWGIKNLSKASDIRKNYLMALKLADKGDYSSLIIFSRS